MRVLVTGGAGFIGAALACALQERGDTVTVLDSLASATARARIEEAGVPLVVGSVTDDGLVRRLVAASDAVVHAAAETHNDWSLRDPVRFVDTNVAGTAIVLEAVRAADVRLHHVSTDEVFGDLPLGSRASFDEESPYRPSSPYSASKAASDHLVRAWARSFGVAATVSHGGNTYGPWQHVEKFIPRQIGRLLSGQAIRLYGDGRNERDWIHLDDHVSAILAILDRGLPGRAYAVGGGSPVSNREVVELLRDVAGMPDARVEYVADRAGHDLRYALDAGRLRSELGWSPARTSLREGLAETFAWYRENEERWRAAFDASERRYGAA